MKQNSSIINGIPYIIFGIAIFLLGMIGQFASVPTLTYSLFLALACLFVTVMNRRPITLRLIDVWIVAYLYLYLSEYLLLYNDVQRMFLRETVHVAEGFIVASFGATLFGYGLTVHPFIKKWAPSLLKYDTEKASPEYHKPRSSNRRISTQSNSTPDVHRKNQNDQTRQILNEDIIPISIVFFVLLSAFIVYFYVVEIVTLQQLFYVSRARQQTQIDVGLTSSFLSSVVVVFPVLSAFLLSRYKLSVFLKGILAATSILAIVVIFAQGSRSPLGFQLIGVAFFALQSFKLSQKQLLMLGFLFFVITSTQAVMRTSRIYGIGNVEGTNFLEVIAKPESHLSSEGVLRINALIHSAQIYANRSGLPENLFIFYWWVPRQIWPEKPKMAGYWIIRDYSYEQVSENHSVSGGFAMPALLDFGPVAGAFFSTIYGLSLTIFETYARRYRNTSSPHVVMVALLFFGVFFMMRSLFTSLIFMMTMFLIAILPLLILFHLSESRLKFNQVHVSSHQQARIHAGWNRSKN